MKLAVSQRVQILKMLCEGMSIRGTARMTGASTTTVLKLIEDAGECCLDLHDELVRGVNSKRVECDELWAFIHTRAKNAAKAKTHDAERGDVWTWTAIDADSKLMISYLAGQRTPVSGETFARDLASRVTDRIQVTTDGLGIYVTALNKAFNGAVDHAMLTKIYANVRADGSTRYAPLEVVGMKKEVANGDPDMERASTSYIERSNLTLRMGNRRYTRLTNAHSKKYANHVYSLAIYLMFYNFIRRHQSVKATPAVAAGIADRAWTFEDIIARMDAVAPKPGPKGPRKLRAQ